MDVGCVQLAQVKQIYREQQLILRIHVLQRQFASEIKCSARQS